MFTNLLIPLDGSQLAEAALPAAAYLAQKLGAAVTLIHVIERHAPKEIHGERHLTNDGEACAYLSEVAARAFPPGLRIEQHVHTDEVTDVARSISEHVGELGSDLIVMCTHGRGGLRSWLFGSIAQQVIALGRCPVLLIQPDAAQSFSGFVCRRLLVPLDGNPEHEQGLPIAAQMARTCSAILHLLMVVHTPDTLSGERAATAKLLPRTATALLNLTQHSAAEYLQSHVAQLQPTGLSVVADVHRGDPARVIVKTAHQAKVDLIVLGTHGKTGMDAFWSGSVPPKISRQSHIPLLLVPVQK